MDTRISVISILVEDPEAVGKVNDLLHDCAQWIRGRMGLPCREKGVNVICVVIDAPMDVTSALSGRLGMLRGVSAKTISSRY